MDINDSKEQASLGTRSEEDDEVVLQYLLFSSILTNDAQAVRLMCADIEGVAHWCIARAQMTRYNRQLITGTLQSHKDAYEFFKRNMDKLSSQSIRTRTVTATQDPVCALVLASFMAVYHDSYNIVAILLANSFSNQKREDKTDKASDSFSSVETYCFKVAVAHKNSCLFSVLLRHVIPKLIKARVETSSVQFKHMQHVLEFALTQKAYYIAHLLLTSELNEPAQMHPSCNDVAPLLNVNIFSPVGISRNELYTIAYLLQMGADPCRILNENDYKARNFLLTWLVYCYSKRSNKWEDMPLGILSQVIETNSHDKGLANMCAILIKLGADPDQAPLYMYKPIHYAALVPNIALVRKFLFLDCSLVFDGHVLVEQLVRRAFYHVLRVLLVCGANRAPCLQGAIALEPSANGLYEKERLWLTDWLAAPGSLKMLCRKAIRAHFARKLTPLLDTLCYPTDLKLYLKTKYLL